MVVITQEMLAAMRRANACRERLSLYRVGQDLGEVTVADLRWAAAAAPDLAATVTAELGLPLWAVGCAGEGYGDGDGPGYGYGEGYGDGHGYGDGDGRPKWEQP